MNSHTHQIITPDMCQGFTLPQVAEKLNVSVGLLRLEAARHKLRLTRCGRRVLVTAESLAAYLKENTD